MDTFVRHSIAFILIFLAILVSAKVIDLEVEYDDNKAKFKFNDKNYYITNTINKVSTDPNYLYDSYQELSISNIKNSHAKSERDPVTTKEFWIYISIIIFLTFFSMLTSGLVVGYLSIDSLQLEIKSKSGTDIEKEQARKILRVVNDRHLVLVTLLIWMAGCMESLPIFLRISYLIKS